MLCHLGSCIRKVARPFCEIITMTSSELTLLLAASLMAWLAGTAKSYVVDVIMKHKPRGKNIEDKKHCYLFKMSDENAFYQRAVICLL